MVWKDWIFWISDNGFAHCADARTGALKWSERLSGDFKASPLAAEGRIYFFSEEGKTTVIAAGRKFEVLAQNTLEDGFMASPAVVGRALFLRTRTHLYRIEN